MACDGQTTLTAAGPEVLLWDGWRKVLVGLVFSTCLGFFGAVSLTLLIYWLFRRSRPGTVRQAFGRLQLLSAAFMAFSHGSNDGQKFIGVFTLALVLGGVLPEFVVPTWVILLCGLTMGVGTALGGWSGRGSGRERHRAGLPARHPAEHRPDHQHGDHGRGQHATPLGRPVGRGARS